MTNKTVIESYTLTRYFGPKRALERLDMTVEKGRILALLGPNGAGKSTFMRLCAGLIEPTKGTVQVLGRDPRSVIDGPFHELASLIDGCEPYKMIAGNRLIELQAEAVPGFDHLLARRICSSAGFNLSERYGSLSKGQRRRLLAAVTIASGEL